MKKNYSCLYLIFLLLVSLLFVSFAARLLPSEQDEKEIKKGDEITQLPTSSSTEMKEDFSTLMGLEECQVKDEECLKRREIAEAHLDYIYTQHHKNP